MSKCETDSYGTKYWFNDKGQYHREDGPALEYIGGEKHWYINGKCHREDGHAIEYGSGSKIWKINDQLHREDGPAAEYADGGKEWFYNDQYIECDSQEEFLRIIKMKAFW